MHTQSCCGRIEFVSRGRDRAIIDGEVVCLDGDGRSIFYNLMKQRWRTGAQQTSYRHGTRAWLLSDLTILRLPHF
jgi:hypothetical protein